LGALGGLVVLPNHVAAQGAAPPDPGALFEPTITSPFATVGRGALDRVTHEWTTDVVAPRRQEAPEPPGRPAIWSVVLPGAGQHVLGQRRKWLYLALEATGWFLYADRRSSGGDLATAYRDFAWEEARVQNGPRMDGDFDYYERLTKWGRSGAFDADPGSAGVQPEMDPSTWNGSVWSLAERLFLPDGPSTPPSDPQYQRALEYYSERGYDDDFLWDWTGTGSAQTEYTELISESDERYRQATNVLGAIIANHVVSAVDAYLSARGIARQAELRIAPALPTDEAGRWHLDLRIPVGR
jgi:hypothetical protein